MGLINSPASYDAWRLSPPHSATPRRRHRFEPETVSANLCVEAGDVQIDAVGHYDATTGALVTVQVNKRFLPVHSVEAALIIMGHDGSAWSDDLDSNELSRLVIEAAEDIEADWADSQRDH